MTKRLLDTQILISYWKMRRSTPLTDDTREDAISWAQDLIKLHDSRAIVTPVYVEMIAGVMSSHELALTRAFLDEFDCVDERDIPPKDWEEAIRLAQRVPGQKGRRKAAKKPRPRKLGDCLIQAIANRLNYDVQSRDKDYG
jgi:predicted nucleic acid-binding protein